MARITEFDNRFLVFFLKQVFPELSEGYYYGFNHHELNKASKKLGMKTNYMADADYVYALIKKNNEHLKNGTLSVDNIIIPELKTAMVTYTETHNELVDTTYYIEIETYSEGDRDIIDYYLDDDSADGINKYDYENDRNHRDTEYYDSSTSIKMRK
jgi:hypothetical protein